MQDDDNIVRAMMMEKLKKEGRLDEAQKLMEGEQKKRLMLFGLMVFNVGLPCAILAGLCQMYQMCFLVFLFLGGFIASYKGYLLRTKQMYGDKVWGENLKDPRARKYVIFMFSFLAAPWVIAIPFLIHFIYTVITNQ